MIKLQCDNSIYNDPGDPFHLTRCTRTATQFYYYKSTYDMDVPVIQQRCYYCYPPYKTDNRQDITLEKYLQLKKYFYLRQKCKIIS